MAIQLEGTAQGKLANFRSLSTVNETMIPGPAVPCKEKSAQIALIPDWNIGLRANAFHTSMTTGKPFNLPTQLKLSLAARICHAKTLSDLKRSAEKRTLDENGMVHSRTECRIRSQEIFSEPTRLWYNLEMSATIENVESTILARVMCVDTPSLPEPIARELLKWGFSDDDRSRMSDLATKARAGTLTAEELAETEAYERVSSFLGLVKSKARQSLNARANGQ